VLAEMVRKELAELTGEARSSLVVDVAYNVVLTAAWLEPSS